MKIALFGGAFDPPHLGHVMAAMHAKLAGGVGRVWVLPSARHPYGKAMAPWDLRMAMCQAAFGDLPWCDIRDDERNNPGGYTIDLVEYLADRHPEHEWWLVGGTDTERDLPNWRRGADLARLVQVHAVPRRGYDDSHPGALPAISSTLIRDRMARGESLDGLLPRQVAELARSHVHYSVSRA
jgi:nicotinate-nucleotide adenylyltransferase